MPANHSLDYLILSDLGDRHSSGEVSLDFDAEERAIRLSRYNRDGSEDVVTVTHDGTRDGCVMAWSVARRIFNSHAGRPALVLTEETAELKLETEGRFSFVRCSGVNHGPSHTPLMLMKRGRGPIRLKPSLTH